MDPKHFIPPQKQIAGLFETVSQSVQEFDPSSAQIASAIHMFAATVTSTFDKHFQRYGLSQPGFLVLLMIYSNSDKLWTAADLIEMIGVRAPTMTGILDTIEKEGFIERKAHPTDRRKNIIALTKKGRSKLLKVLPDHFSRIHHAFSGISSVKKKNEIINIFQEIKQALNRFLSKPG